MRTVTLAVFIAACSPPIGVRHMDPQAVQHQLTANELSTGKPSVPSRIVLQRRALLTPGGDRASAGREAAHLAARQASATAYSPGVLRALIHTF